MYPTSLIFLFAVLHSQHNMYLSVTLHYKVNSSKASFFLLFPTVHKHLEHCSEHRPNKQLLIHYPNIDMSHHFLQVVIYVRFDCFTPSFLDSNQPVSLLIQSVTM